ncbi:glycoprotein 3-alpha-L-fucosyltransferase A-like [Haliotis cracherodii]|uniref:glycoprotein 3-alpha-L-fucosyltransferase A-like n=1 Tax=Haliotis cracherodii TaxID=6455 RepID=UPI0039EA486E
MAFQHYKLHAQPRYLMYCVAFLIVAVIFGIGVFYISVDQQTSLWSALQRADVFNFTGIIPKHPQMFYPRNVSTRNPEADVQTPFKLVFPASKTIPYFLRPVSSTPNGRFRKRFTYDNYSLDDIDTSGNESKLILFYNRPVWFGVNQCIQGIQDCPQKACTCSNDPEDIAKADAVIIDAVGLKDATPPTSIRRADQMWIMFGLESPVHYHNNYYLRPQWRQAFNWTMTYRLDSDIVLPYDMLQRRKKASQTNFTKVALNKTKSVLWFVSHCKTHSKRESYVRELAKYITVDIYGQCGPFKCSRKCGHLYDNQYRFYLSFENSLCIDYITEKLFKTYNYNIVPVVRGGADYGSLVPNGTYINAADFSSPKKLGNYLKYLEQNITAYTEILREKARYSPNGQNAHSSFCDMCTKLHNLDKYSNYYHDHVKWLQEDICY